VTLQLATSLFYHTDEYINFTNFKQKFSKIALATGFLLAFIGCVSAPPSEPVVCWQKESCLATTYPESEWYFAFAEDTLGVSREAWKNRH